MELEFPALVDVGLDMLPGLNLTGQKLHGELVGDQILNRSL